MMVSTRVMTSPCPDAASRGDLIEAPVWVSLPQLNSFGWGAASLVVCFLPSWCPPFRDVLAPRTPGRAAYSRGQVEESLGGLLSRERGAGSREMGRVGLDLHLDAGSSFARAANFCATARSAPPKTTRGTRDATIFPVVGVTARAPGRRRRTRPRTAGRLRLRVRDGGPMYYRNVVRRGLDKATDAAKLTVEGQPRLRWHLRTHLRLAVHEPGRERRVCIEAAWACGRGTSCSRPTTRTVRRGRARAAGELTRLEEGFAEKVLQSGAALQPLTGVHVMLSRLLRPQAGM